MVLHHRNYNLIAFLHKFLAEGGSHKIKSFSGASCEYYLIHTAGIDKTSHSLACSLMKVGSLL